MALAALIFASQTIDDGSDTLRAVLPLAGASLLEHQVRRAVRAGAGHIVVLVERLPAALIAAIDRLRRDGTRIDVARNVSDAAGRIHPDESVLIIADGCIVGAAVIDRLIASLAPAVLTLADQPGLDDFERIDAQMRWAGLALLDGARLHATAAMLGDWDFELTLLRRAIQDGAAFIPALGEGGEPPVFARRATDLATLERRIIAGSSGLREGWPARYIFPQIERLGFARLARGRMDAWWLGLAAILSALAAIPLMALGWFATALGLLIVSGPIASIARRLADVRITRLRHERRLAVIRLAAAGAALVALGIRLGDDGQWGWALFAVMTIGVMIALASERRTAHRLDNRAAVPFMATGDGLIWLMIPFAITGAWRPAIMIAALYAVTSFAVAQRLVHDAIAAKARGQQV